MTCNGLTHSTMTTTKTEPGTESVQATVTYRENNSFIFLLSEFLCGPRNGDRFSFTTTTSSSVNNSPFINFA